MNKRIYAINAAVIFAMLCVATLSLYIILPISEGNNIYDLWLPAKRMTFFATLLVAGFACSAIYTTPWSRQNCQL